MPVAAMTVKGGVAVVLRICFMAHSVKKLEGVRMQAVSARTFSNRMYRNLWEHAA